MCYTGLCKYEVTSGQYAGECTIPRGSNYPDDAGCIQAEREQEEEAREKALKELEAPRIRR